MIEKENDFVNKLMKWNVHFNNRDMPWKEEVDPYKVWLSEIILQQTKVEQGTSYYLSFINEFPTVFDLAAANEDLVMKMWEGLGYYSRARNLHFTAKFIVNDLNGVFPDNFNDLLKLKGVGEYTAAAISSFVFKEKVAVVDGNVIRVLSRFFAIDVAFDTSQGKKLFKEKANQIIDNDKPDKYNQAIMDFGATVCKPKNPLCEVCTLNENCLAFNEGRVAELPFKSKKIKVLKRFFIAFHIETPLGFVVEQRTENDIWKKLFQFPLIEINDFDIDIEKQGSEAFKNQFNVENFKIVNISKTFKQKLTHREINVVFVKIVLKENLKLKDKYLYTRNLTKFAFPKVFILYFKSKSIILE